MSAGTKESGCEELQTVDQTKFGGGGGGLEREFEEEASAATKIRRGGGKVNQGRNFLSASRFSSFPRLSNARICFLRLLLSRIQDCLRKLSARVQRTSVFLFGGVRCFAS